MVAVNTKNANNINKREFCISRSCWGVKGPLLAPKFIWKGNNTGPTPAENVNPPVWKWAPWNPGNGLLWCCACACSVLCGIGRGGISGSCSGCGIVFRGSSLFPPFP